MDSFFLMLLGAVLVIPIWQMIDLARYRWRGTRVMGQVIKLDEQDDGDGRPACAPVIEYRVGANKWRIKPEGYVYPALYRVGQEVPIYYFPDNPRMGP